MTKKLGKLLPMWPSLPSDIPMACPGGFKRRAMLSGGGREYAASPGMEFSPLSLPADWNELLDHEVEILGPNVPPHELARATGMVPEEFFVRLSLTFPRKILGSGEIR